MDMQFWDEVVEVGEGYGKMRGEGCPDACLVLIEKYSCRVGYGVI